MDTQKSIETLQFFVTQLSNGSFQHKLQSRVFSSQGYQKLAKKFSDHSAEEDQWVEKFIDRILDLGGEIKLESRDCAPIVTEPVEYMNAEVDRQCKGLEILSKCMDEVKSDVTTYDIFKDYFKDEEQDLYDDQTAIELIKKLGETNWLLTQL